MHAPASRLPLLILATIAAAVATVAACGGSDDDDDDNDAQDPALVEQGKQIFRFDTFGDEAKWTDTLRLHEVISAAVDPVTALSVGLKVDSDALPASVVQGIQNGSIDLESPATTIALLKLDAVVGLKGTVETVAGKDTLTRVGITCALCHSTVDNSFAPGIGKRLDGWPNRDLNPGAIIALSPAVDAAMKAVFNSWGKGMFDPRANIDGLSKPVVIPPAYGLDGIHSVTFTGDGREIAYWNRYVAVTQMGGQGSFSEPRLNLNITNGSAGPGLEQAACAAGLPALAAGAAATGRQLRCRRRGSGPGDLQRRGPLRDLPQRQPVHRWQPDAASDRRLDGRAGEPELRLALGEQAVPDLAAQGRVAARAVLPRRVRRHAGRCGQRLQREARAGSHGPADRRPGGVPEVPVKRAPPAIGRACL